MIKLEFPADRPDIARSLGQALIDIANSNDQPQLQAGTSSPYTEEQLDFDLVRATTEISTSTGPVETAPVKSEVEEHTAESEATNYSAPAENADGAAQTVEPISSTPSENSVNADTLGVVFDGNFCGKAKDPFYTSGKRKGQWKKKKGVSDEDYDAWYQSQLEPGVMAAGGMFNNGELLEEASIQPETPQTSSASLLAASPTVQEQPSTGPKDGGELMVWVSEQQAAGKLTQDELNSSWQANGVGSPADLFGPNAEQTVVAIYTYLSSLVAQKV